MFKPLAYLKANFKIPNVKFRTFKFLPAKLASIFSRIKPGAARAATGLWQNLRSRWRLLLVTMAVGAAFLVSGTVLYLNNIFWPAEQDLPMVIVEPGMVPQTTDDPPSLPVHIEPELAGTNSWPESRDETGITGKTAGVAGARMPLEPNDVEEESGIVAPAPGIKGTLVDPHSMVPPVPGAIVRTFGFNFSPTYDDYRYHDGVDIQVSTGTEAVAVLAGKVSQVEYSKYHGYTVTVDHGQGWKTGYAHLAGVSVEEGARVEQGSVIGFTGEPGLDEKAVGSHLHFQISFQEEPLDPLTYLPQLITQD